MLPTMHKLDNLSFQEVATLGVALATIGQVLYWVLKLPLPSTDALPNSSTTVLVYGGGTIAIQAAKLWALIRRSPRLIIYLR